MDNLVQSNILTSSDNNSSGLMTNAFQGKVLNSDIVDDYFSLKSRFRPQYSLRQKVQIYLLKFVIKLTKGSFIMQTKHPFLYYDPYWQSIVRFLYKHGVISSPNVFFGKVPNDEPKIISCGLHTELTVKWTDGVTNAKNGWLGHGTSYEYHETVSKAVGETLERYFLARYKNDNLLHASVKQLKNSGRRYVSPSVLSHFSEKQHAKIPEINYTDDTTFQWEYVTQYSDNSPTLIPAQLVFWNYKIVRGEKVLRLSNTNGAAGGFTREEAILSGIYEIVHRDSFLLFWLNNMVPPRINPKSIKDQDIQKIFSDLQRYNLEGHIVDVTTDLGIFACAFVIVDREKNGIAVTVGGGSGNDKVAAIKRAYTEALIDRHALSLRQRKYSLPQNYEHFIDSVSQDDRIALWANPEMIRHIERFISGEMSNYLDDQNVQELFSDTRDEIKGIISKISQSITGMTVYVYDAKDTILDKLGYHVVQVIIPELVPLYLVERYAPITMPRIQSWAKTAGHDTFCLNEVPHPFP